MWIGEKLVKFVEFLGPKGTLAAIFTGMLAKEAWWLARGAMLGMGFNMTASVGGSGGGRGFGTGKMLGKLGSPGRAIANSKGFKGIAGMSMAGKVATGAGTLGAGIVGDLAGGAASKALGNESNAVGDVGSMIGTGIGAAIGTAILPGIGTVIGAGLGSMGGKMLGDWIGTDKAKKGGTKGDFSSSYDKSITEVPDGIIRFDPNDKFMMSESAVVASTSKNQLNKFSEKVSNGVSEVKHMFDDIKISISINATGMDNDIAKQIIDDKKFIRQLKTRINEEASMVLSGGILSGNPK